MKILVKITEAIIEASKGCERNISCCLIARACNQIFEKCYVGPNIDDNWEIHHNGKNIELPEKAAKLAKSFDNGHMIEPTSFEIDVPMEIIEQVGIGEVYKTLSESKTLELVSI